MEINNRVQLQNPLTKTWESGRVVADTNTPRSVIVETDQGGTYRRSTRHVRKSNVIIPVPPEAVCDDPRSPFLQKNPVTPEEQRQHPTGAVHNQIEPTEGHQVNVERAQRIITRSGRLVKPIQRCNVFSYLFFLKGKCDVNDTPIHSCIILYCTLLYWDMLTAE